MRSIFLATQLLSARERRRGMLVLLAAVVMALFEVAAVASVVPFLTMLANPNAVTDRYLLSIVYEFLSFRSEREFMIFLGMFCFGLLLAAAVVRTVGQYALIRFAQMRRHSLGLKLFRRYLSSPYERFLFAHSGDVTKTILSEVDQFIATICQPIAIMIGQLFTLIAIISLLLIINLNVTIIVSIFLCGSYLVVFFGLSNYIDRIGKRRLAANRDRFTTAADAFGGIKTTKLFGLEDLYLTRFRESSYVVSHNMAINQILSYVPRYTIEALALGGIILLSLILLMRSEEVSSSTLQEVLPMLGLYAMAAYRMLPAVQAVYRAGTQMRFGEAALAKLLSELEAPAPQLPERDRHSAIRFQRELRLENVGFTYPDAERAGLAGISLSIPSGSFLGIVGATGAGKTTLVDIILGLLTAQRGRMLADGTPIDGSNVRAWQRAIGYVPQDIFLLDASIAQNIAIGALDDSEIDPDRLREAARMAAALEFIEAQSEGFETRVGERGMRLSGGQRQRIGIARALYRNPDLLVFDEATNALDSTTERSVLEGINLLKGRKTVIMVAHRLSTLESCDRIAVLDNGVVTAIGTFDELVASSDLFRRLVEDQTV